jgi:hypothetical protein
VQHEAGWLSWLVAFSKLGLQCCDRMTGLLALARESCWVSLWRGAALVCDRQSQLHRDDRNRLHSETGPAISWPDGWGIYAIHGVRVPQFVVERPDQITLPLIAAEKNAEVRRVMRSRYGEGRYLIETGAKLIDSDHETARKGAAPRCLIEDSEGQRFLVGTDGSTSRTYYMRVRKEVTTCRQAHESLCGFPERSIVNKS